MVRDFSVQGTGTPHGGVARRVQFKWSFCIWYRKSVVYRWSCTGASEFMSSSCQFVAPLWRVPFLAALSATIKASIWLSNAPVRCHGCFWRHRMLLRPLIIYVNEVNKSYRYSLICGTGWEKKHTMSPPHIIVMFLNYFFLQTLSKRCLGTMSVSCGRCDPTLLTCAQ